MELMTVDGSLGEGGGQVLRTAIALSAILQKSVRIHNIRKTRPRPGLGIQHVKSIELAQCLCDAGVKGLGVGSTEIEFTPGPIKSGDFTINIGSAGSVTLALQTILPIAAYAPGQVAFDITGGTDVKWSPPYDYFENITLPVLKLFGFHIESALYNRGFFPVGSGRVYVRTTPATLHGIELTRPFGEVVNGVSASSRLPPHVVARQSRSAVAYLTEHGYEPGEIRPDVRNDLSTGSSITLYKGYVGGSSLGERGVPAEKVGREAASMLVEGLNTGAAVDAHLADQLIIYMALAAGHSSITVSHVTGHTSTGIRLVELMTGRKLEVIKNKVSVIRS